MAGTDQYGAPYRAKDYADQVAEQANNVVETVGEMSNVAGQNVKRVMKDAASGIQRTADYFRGNDFQKISGDVRDYARENPIQALIGAVVAGFVLGRVISRR